MKEISAEKTLYISQVYKIKPTKVYNKLSSLIGLTQRLHTTERHPTKTQMTNLVQF